MRLWMGLSPAAEATRVLVLDGPGRTLLKARLPARPAHRRAVQTLCEALALWCGRPVSAALAADDPDAFCDTTPWLESWDGTLRTPLYEIRLVTAARPPRGRDALAGLGDFRDLRQLLLFEVAE